MTGRGYLTIQTRNREDTPLLTNPDHFREALSDGLAMLEMQSEVEVEQAQYDPACEVVEMKLKLDPSTSADYTDKHNAAGLATDLEFAVAFGLYRSEWYEINAAVVEKTFCSHPESERYVELSDSPYGSVEITHCDECGFAVGSDHSDPIVEEDKA